MVSMVCGVMVILHSALVAEAGQAAAADRHYVMTRHYVMKRHYVILAFKLEPQHVNMQGCVQATTNVFRTQQSKTLL